MGIFFRKSKKIGPFRLNFSSSGIGVSTGITGARVSVGPNGTFVHLGRNGIYYRKKINASRDNKSSNRKVEDIDLNEIFSFNQDEKVITTSNFDNITDSDSTEFVKTLEKQDKKVFLYKWLGVLPFVLCALFILFHNKTSNVTTQVKEENIFTIETEGANLREEPGIKGSVIKVALKEESFLVLESLDKWSKIQISKDTIGFVNNSVGKESIRQLIIEQPGEKVNKIPRYLLLFFIPLIVILFRIDKKRKRIEIFYSVEDEFGELYDLQKKFFKEFCSNRKIWQKTKSKGVRNSKYHAGASNLVDRIVVKKVEMDSLPSPLIKTNVEIPHISLSNIDLYFFPERLILKRGKSFAAVFYKNMNIQGTKIRFIETEPVPKDSTIIDKTWKFVNKRGGPDKRFKNNRQLPICQYSEYHISCDNGINEIIMTSRTDGMSNFAKYLNKVGDYQIKLR